MTQLPDGCGGRFSIAVGRMGVSPKDGREKLWWKSLWKKIMGAFWVIRHYADVMYWYVCINIYIYYMHTRRGIDGWVLLRPKTIPWWDKEVEKPVATVFPGLFRNESNCRDDGKSRPLGTRGDGGPPSYAIVMYYYYLLVCWNCFGDFLNVFFVKRIYVISQQRITQRNAYSLHLWVLSFVTRCEAGWSFHTIEKWQDRGCLLPCWICVRDA